MNNHLSMMSEKLAIIKEYLKKGFHEWRNEFFEYKYLILLSLIIVAIATFLDYFSGVYVSSTTAADVPDLILDHIGPFDMSFLFVYGYLALVFTLFLYPLFLHIRTLHMVVSQLSLLVMLRALFMIFTHLQTPLSAIPVHFPWIFGRLSFQNDMFFSGHTAIPFLGFFLFKRSWIRYLFLIGSIFLAITALLMHRHYSIDVFAAFFITYCSYRLGQFSLGKIEPYIKK